MPRASLAGIGGGATDIFLTYLASDRGGHHPEEGMGEDNPVLRRMIIEHIIVGILTQSFFQLGYHFLAECVDITFILPIMPL